MSKFIILTQPNDNKLAVRKEHVKRFYELSNASLGKQTAVDTGDYTWNVKESVDEIHKLLYKKGKK